MPTTYLEAIRSLSSYPIPLRTVTEAADRRGLALDAEVPEEGFQSREYMLAKADILMWLALAPAVSQGGQSYSFSEEQRSVLRQQARAIYSRFEPESNAARPTFGYKGSRL